MRRNTCSGTGLVSLGLMALVSAVVSTSATMRRGGGDGGTAAAGGEIAPPNMCNAGRYLLCTGRKLASRATPSHDACCAVCKATSNCTGWAWDAATRLCTALWSCDAATGSLDGYSGTSQHHLPRPVWPVGQPPALPYPFRNASLSLPQRIRWLLSNLTQAEKIGLLSTRTGAIPRYASPLNPAVVMDGLEFAAKNRPDPHTDRGAGRARNSGSPSARTPTTLSATRGRTPTATTQR
jgi:hypothetical protein